MIRLHAAVIAALLASVTAGGQPPPHTFDAGKPGSLPDGFTVAAMRQPSPGTWLVRRDGTNGVLVHQGEAAAQGLAMALAPDTPLRDVVASVRLRLAGGARSGGLVWRYLDAANYHAALLDLAEGEIVLFRVAGGNRVFLESEDGLELDVGAWHTLKIVHDEAQIDVSLGGIRVFRERDRRYDAGATKPGRTGVIVEGSSEVWFDDLRVEERRDRR